MSGLIAVNYLQISNIKYFITAEYGPTTFRPHYHGLIRNIIKKDFDTYFLHDWNHAYSFTTRRILPSNIETSKDPQCTLRYVAKYCNKGEPENTLVKENVVAPVFRMMSKGLVFHTFSVCLGIMFSPSMTLKKTADGIQSFEL